jgi:tetratricopeptide (TPR) repeat protein
MKTSWRLGVLAVVSVVLAGAAVITGSSIEEGSSAPPLNAQTRDSDIGFFEARVQRDQHGARDRAALGALYLARARAEGSESDYRAAERLARESWHTRGKRNPDALPLLIGALLAQHRFVEAHDAALILLANDSSPVAFATLGEVNLELGRYAEADSLFRTVSVQRSAPAIAPRYARWLELSGRSGEARDLLERVRARTAAGFRAPPEQLAWYDLRIGDLAYRNGRADLAEQAYQRGLDLLPDDPRLLTALAQLRGAQGRWPEAITLGEQALGTLFDPATLGLLSRACLAIGDSAKAEEFAHATEVAVSRTSGAFHRGWALFLLDRGRQVDTILARARSDLRVRKDIYGYDLTAWALHRAGRSNEAMVLIDSALARGTRDATLHYHAARIAESLGRLDRMRAEDDSSRAISRLAVSFIAATEP